MYPNSSSFPFTDPRFAQDALPNPGSTPTTPLLHQLHADIKQPTLKNKPAKYLGLPDQPDRAGMRERRDQDQMTLSELKRSRGVAPAENLHAEILEAYGYRQFIELMMDIPSMGAKALNAVGDAMSFRIGPPGADAASASSERQSPEAFSRKHKGIFRVSLNQLAKSRQDMSGVVVLIVEAYSDKASRRNVAAVLRDYKKQPSNRFFLEGGTADICKSRSEIYGIELSACQLMEKGSSRFQELDKADVKVYVNLLACLRQMKTLIPELASESNPETTEEARVLLLRYLDKLPAGGREKIHSRFKAVADSMEEFTSKATQTNAKRAKDMANFIRKNRSTDGLNYVVIAKGQEEYLPKLLSDLPCITLGSLPGSVDGQYVELKSSKEQKQEL
jgi:hypothetical protein